MTKAHGKYEDVYVYGDMNFPGVKWNQIDSGVKIDSNFNVLSFIWII